MTDKKSIAKAGEHEARVVHVVRCGKHTPRNDKYNKGSTPRLWITYELLDEQNEEGRNRWLSFVPYGEPINSYFTEKGKQADWLSDIGIKSNTEEALQSAVNCPVWVDVVHNTNPNTGITYGNVGDVNKVRTKDAEDFGDLTNPAIYFDFYKPIKEDYISLPKWIKDYIKKADDLVETGMDKVLEGWDKEGAAAYAAANTPEESRPTPAPAPRQAPADEEFEEDIPF